MKFNIDPTVVSSELEAGVGLAKIYRGCHRSRVVCDEVLTATECLDVVRDPAAAAGLRSHIKRRRQNPSLTLKVRSSFSVCFYYQQTQMADPLSVTASAVGIIVPALHGTRLLLEDLQQLKDARKTVKRLTDGVHSVHITLELL